MSRSGYSDDCWGVDLINWRGAVASAIRGKRGQAFLYEMLCAMAAVPEPRLIAGELEQGGAVCAIGAVGRARGIDMRGIDVEDREQVAKPFGIAEALAAEIVFENDEGVFYSRIEAPEERFLRMRSWIERCLIDGCTPPPGEWE